VSNDICLLILAGVYTILTVLSFRVHTGAIHGYTEIPLEWRIGLKDHEKIAVVYEQLVLQAMQMKL